LQTTVPQAEELASAFPGVAPLSTMVKERGRFAQEGLKIIPFCSLRDERDEIIDGMIQSITLTSDERVYRARGKGPVRCKTEPSEIIAADVDMLESLAIKMG
jgi:hypothetical protein